MKTKQLILSLALTALMASSLRAETGTAALERKIEQVFYRADATLATGVENELTTALQAEPKSSALLYYRGFFDYAKTSLLHRDKADKKILRAALEAAEVKLKDVKGQPWQAEAEALRGMISGQLISVRGGASAMSLGPKMAELTTGALESQPNSPRAKICRAVSYLNSPAMFGGDKKQAMLLFNAAVSTYETAATKTGELSWGKAYSYAWLAQAKFQNGDAAGAREAANQALEIEPAYGWVKGIIDAMDAKEKK